MWQQTSAVSGSPFGRVGSGLLYREFCKLAHVGIVEAQNNVGFGHAHFYQIVGDIIFGAVVLNPAFAVFDVEMEKTAIVTPTVASPAHMDELIVVSLFIEDDLGFGEGCGRGLSGPLDSG